MKNYIKVIMIIMTVIAWFEMQISISKANRDVECNDQNDRFSFNNVYS